MLSTEQQIAQFWQQLTEGLGAIVDLAVLSAIATEGHSLLGRGSVKVDPSGAVIGRVVSYMARQNFLSGISGVEADTLASLLETYDPDTQFVVSVLLPTDQPELLDTHTFFMDLEPIADSPTAQAMVSFIHQYGLVAHGNNLN